MKICVVPIVLVFAMTLGSIASGQTSVYDARGRFVGKYQAYVGSTSGDDFGEAAIRQINGVWLALQVSTAGFTGVPPSSYYAEPTGDIFFSGANCTGKPYLGSSSDAQVGSPGDLMAAVPSVQEGIVINSTVYYIDPPASYFRSPAHIPRFARFKPPSSKTNASLSTLVPVLANLLRGCCPQPPIT
jgi:hypothetical protein